MSATRAADPTGAGTRWRGMPAHERQAERRRLLVDAALDMLGSHGLAGTTVRGVCEATKLNPRYFYESFDDLDALLVAVFDQVATDAFELMLTAAQAQVEAAGGAEPDPLTMSRATIGAFVRHLVEDPRRARVLFAEGLSNAPLMRRRIEAMHSLTQLLEYQAAERSPAAVDPVVKVAAILVVGGMSELMLAWLDGRLDVTVDELVDNAAALFVATAEAAQRIAEGRAAPSRRRKR